MRAIRSRADPMSVVSLVSVGHFVSHLYLLAYPPLFPLLQAEFETSTAQLGLLVTAIYVPTLLLQIPVGEVVDRVGAKRTLVAGIAVTSLGITLSGVAGGYWTLVAFALLSGLGQSTFHPADYALLDVATDPSNEGTAFSAHTFSGYVGFAVAPILIGGLGVAYGWQFALVATGLGGFGYAAVLGVALGPVYRRRLRTLEDPIGDDDGGGAGTETGTGADVLASVRSLLTPGRTLVFLFYLVSMMAVVGLQSFTTVLAVDAFGFAESTANSVLSAFLVAMAIGVLVGGPLADRLPSERVLVATFLLAAVAVWLATVGLAGRSLAAVVAVFGLAGLLIGVALPSRDKIANSVAETGSTGKSFGFYFTGLSLGAVVSPTLLGLLIDFQTVVAAFIAVGAFLVVAATIIVALARVTG